MKWIKKFNEAKPALVTRSHLDYSDMMKYLEEKYNFESRGFTGIPSEIPDVTRHFYRWCDAHNLNQKDSEGKNRGSSQEFYKMYQVAEDGEKAKPPYMDYWHYLCDINPELHNGSYISIPRHVDSSHKMTTQSSLDMFNRLLANELKKKKKSGKYIADLKELIRREEEELKNPKVDPWHGWEQQITDLIFKEFGEHADGDYLEVWVDW